jgi:exopolysaccharide biosynthesis polyprenyl glycosylphosphotransferase
MDTILLYDSRIDEEQKASARNFTSKIQYKYGHLFDFREIYPINEIEDTCDHLMKYKNAFLYEIPIEVRSKIIACCVKNDIRFYITPTIGDVIARGYEVKHFIDKPILASKESYNHRTEYVGKRALDIIFSLLLLIIASPIMLIAAIAVKVEDGGNVFFKQARVTRGGKVFNIVKFRSMVMNAEKDGKPRPAIEGDPRITRVGRFIRKTRIDELPQLFNILAGQMSLVGPRAERVEHVELYTKKIPEFKYRLSVKAGLTGYAQIYGKYNTSAQDKLLLDLLYIEKQSLVVDAKIMFLTIKTVFTSESTEGFTDETSKKINQKSIEEEAEKV